MNECAASRMGAAAGDSAQRRMLADAAHGGVAAGGAARQLAAMRECALYFEALGQRQEELFFHADQVCWSLGVLSGADVRGNDDGWYSVVCECAAPLCHDSGHPWYVRDLPRGVAAPPAARVDPHHPQRGLLCEAAGRAQAGMDACVGEGLRVCGQGGEEQTGE
jgi:hypothetical protein